MLIGAFVAHSLWQTGFGHRVRDADLGIHWGEETRFSHAVCHLCSLGLYIGVAHYDINYPSITQSRRVPS